MQLCVSGVLTATPAYIQRLSLSQAIGVARDRRHSMKQRRRSARARMCSEQERRSSATSIRPRPHAHRNLQSDNLAGALSDELQIRRRNSKILLDLLGSSNTQRNHGARYTSTRSLVSALAVTHDRWHMHARRPCLLPVWTVVAHHGRAIDCRPPPQVTTAPTIRDKAPRKLVVIEAGTIPRPARRFQLPLWKMPPHLALPLRCHRAQ